MNGPTRVLPALTGLNSFFWTSGRDGVLSFQRCQDCGLYLHPPAPVCRRCGSESVKPEAVSGAGTVFSYTVNRHAWVPSGDGSAGPYVVALVELPEQAALRLMTNIVGCPPDAVAIGLPVRVEFLHVEDVWIPVFAPAGPA